MQIFRITHERFAHELFASGLPGRWNSKDVLVIYAAESRSLACLENVVHRSAVGLAEQFCVMTIEFPRTLQIEILDLKTLPENWRSAEQVHITRKLGDEWAASLRTPLLKVPSAVVPGEWNYLLNYRHKSFKRIKLIKFEPFVFDARIKDLPTKKG